MSDGVGQTSTEPLSNSKGVSHIDTTQRQGLMYDEEEQKTPTQAGDVHVSHKKGRGGGRGTPLMPGRVIPVVKTLQLIVRIIMRYGGNGLTFNARDRAEQQTTNARIYDGAF